MKELLMILFGLSSLAAQCQLGWEEFYTVKDFRVMLQQAKNPKEKIYALGLLGRKGLSTDSIMREIYAIVDRTNDKKLKSSALWWDAMLHDDDTTRMIKLFQFAEQTQLAAFQIAADLLLADYYIHHSIDQSLSYAKAADSLFEKVFDSNSLHLKYPLLFLNQRAPGHGDAASKLHLNLVEANRRQLLDAGLAEKNIWVSDLCTSCRTDLLFSHRAEFGQTGRMMAAIGIRP